MSALTDREFAKLRADSQRFIATHHGSDAAAILVRWLDHTERPIESGIVHSSCTDECEVHHD